MTIISTLQRFRFIWLNLLFAGYLWFLQPAVLQRLAVSSQSEHPDWLIGGLLLGIQVFELVGLQLKRLVSAFFSHRYPDVSTPGGCRENGKVALFVLTPILHIGASAMLTIVASDLLGMGPNDDGSTLGQCLFLLLFFAVLFKEAFFVVLMLSIGTGATAPGQNKAQSRAL